MQTDTPSRTAEYVALFRALESTRPAGERMVCDPDAVRFLSPTLRAATRAARFAPARSLLTSYIDHRWPGPRLSAVVRTRVIDDFVTAAIEHDGCTQLLLLGAGYDTRATRLAAASSVAAFEVDHPATQARKRALLASGTASVRYVGVDFERDTLVPALVPAGFDMAERSCVVWEGVLSYLTPDAIDETLAAIVDLTAAGSRLVLTYVDESAVATGSDGQPWVSAVRDVGEPFTTGLDPGAAPAFFAARGLTLDADESTRDAAVRLGVPGATAIPGFYRIASLTVAAA